MPLYSHHYNITPHCTVPDITPNTKYNSITGVEKNYQACVNTQVTNIIVDIGPVNDICKWLQGIIFRLLLPQDQSPVPCDPNNAC